MAEKQNETPKPRIPARGGRSGAAWVLFEG